MRSSDAGRRDWCPRRSSPCATDSAEDDPLNALTLSAGLAWREVALVRAYLAAAFQMRLVPARRPRTARCCSIRSSRASWSIFFLARFDPDRESPHAE